MSAQRRRQRFTVEQEQAIVAWACRQQIDQVEQLDTTYIFVRLIGRLEDQRTGVIDCKVEKELALEVAEASLSLSMRDLQDIVADATHFLEAPVIVISTSGVELIQ